MNYYIDIDDMNIILFLKENNVISTIVSFTIATYLNQLIKSFYEDFIFCFLDADCDANNIPDAAYIFKWQPKIFGITFKIGKLILSLFKFIISVSLVFLISNMFKYILTHYDN